nr:[LysW]-lysine hydrolase [Ardenticatena sp.]
MNGIDLLEALVRIPSISGEEEEAVRWLVETMGRLGYHAFRDEVGNAVGIRGHGPRQLVLLGHIDTVPGGPPVERRNGRLYGRGTVDAKGPLAAFVTAGAAVEVPDDWQLIVIGAVEEESATSKGARYAATCYRPDACVIGEPSGWDAITLGYKGRLLADIEVRRPTTHTAGPEARAPEVAVAYWNAITAALDALPIEREGAFWRVQPSLRRINSAQEGNHDVVHMTLGFRLPPTILPTEIERLLHELAPESATVQTYGAEPAFVAHRTTPLARAFQRAISAAGTRPRFKHKTGTSDMNVVGPIWRCPILAYGPGDSALDHTPDEHIEIDEFERGVAVLTMALQTIMHEPQTRRG